MAWLVIVNGNNLTTEQRLREIIVSELEDSKRRSTPARHPTLSPSRPRSQH
jgi:hypothetical protein